MYIKKADLFCFSNDENSYATAGKSLDVFSIDYGKCVRSIPIYCRECSGIKFSSDDRYIVLYGSSQNKLIIYDYLQGKIEEISFNFKNKRTPHIYVTDKYAYLVFGVLEVVPCCIICIELNSGAVFKTAYLPSEYYVKSVDFSHLNNELLMLCEVTDPDLINRKIYENEYVDYKKYTNAVSLKYDEQLNLVYKIEKSQSVSVISEVYLSKYNAFMSSDYGYMMNATDFSLKTVIAEDIFVERKSNDEKFLLCEKNGEWLVLETDNFSTVNVFGRFDNNIVYGEISSSGKYAFLNGNRRGLITKTTDKL